MEIPPWTVTAIFAKVWIWAVSEVWQWVTPAANLVVSKPIALQVDREYEAECVNEVKLS